MNEKYVKLSDVKKKLNYIYRTYGISRQMKQTISDALARIPYTVEGELETTIESEPVRYGRWVVKNDFWRKCSMCGETCHEQWVMSHALNYCPNCGAKIEEEKNV